MPLLKKQEAPLWGIWEIKESAEELLSFLKQTKWYSPFLQKIKMECRRQEWLAVRVLLKHLLGREAHIDYKESGMPYLPDYPDLHISISHTKGYAAILLSDLPLPGIDIEYISPRIKKVTSRFMSEQELQQVDKSCELGSFLLYWSAKETVFKALQQSDVDFCKHIYIRPFIPTDSGWFYAIETSTPFQRRYLVNYEINNDFVVTYTTG